MWLLLKRALVMLMMSRRRLSFGLRKEKAIAHRQIKDDDRKALPIEATSRWLKVPSTKRWRCVA